jgi:spoIIIJ-associated protein
MKGEGMETAGNGTEMHGPEGTETADWTSDEAPRADAEAATETRLSDPSPEGAGLETESEAPEPADEPFSEDAAPVDPMPVARDLLDQILQAMGVPASVTAEPAADGAVRLLVEGPEMGVVIGKHGGTINALQYLLGLMIQKRVGERVRLVIDAEGYRGRREQALRDLAHTYAQRVKESGEEAVLDALAAYERRIIHQSLMDDPDVFTYSEGEEPDRRVVISPRDPEAA